MYHTFFINNQRRFHGPYTRTVGGSDARPSRGIRGDAKRRCSRRSRLEKARCEVNRETYPLFKTRLHNPCILLRNVCLWFAQATRRVGALSADAERNCGRRRRAREVYTLPKNSVGSLLPEGVQRGRMLKSWSVVRPDRGRCMRPLTRYRPTQRYTDSHKYSGAYNAAPAMILRAAPSQKVRCRTNEIARMVSTYTSARTCCLRARDANCHLLPRGSGCAADLAA